MSLVSTFGSCLLKSGKKYGNLVVLNPDCLEETGVMDFAKYFGERFFNFGQAHLAMALSAVGFNAAGKMPVLTVDSDFVGRTWEQVRKGICEENLNIKIVAVGGEEREDLELVKLMPNIKIVEVSDEESAALAVEEMLEEYGPIYLRIFNDQAIYNRQQGVL